jgi:nuclear transport factor 2 (NTF2) superfamily protein|tara:strand:+ start:1658 stop:1969 length:312 start_codon:yes stop_codon:yes gene_type:complete
MSDQRPPFPPFDEASALKNVLGYALRKDVWAYTGNRIAVSFQYESVDAGGQWWRSYGKENWKFDVRGLMHRREASINDVAIDEGDKQLFRPRADGDTNGIPLR